MQWLENLKWCPIRVKNLIEPTEGFPNFEICRNSVNRNNCRARHCSILICFYDRYFLIL